MVGKVPPSLPLSGSVRDCAACRDRNRPRECVSFQQNPLPDAESLCCFCAKPLAALTSWYDDNTVSVIMGGGGIRVDSRGCGRFQSCILTVRLPPPPTTTLRLPSRPEHRPILPNDSPDEVEAEPSPRIELTPPALTASSMLLAHAKANAWFGGATTINRESKVVVFEIRVGAASRVDDKHQEYIIE